MPLQAKASPLDPALLFNHFINLKPNKMYPGSNKIKTCIFICLVALSIVSCKKNENSDIGAENVHIMEVAVNDTVHYKISHGTDTTFTVKFEAGIQGPLSANAHAVTFKVDTTTMAAFRAKYGDAAVLPSDSYEFSKASCQIPAGTGISESAAINVLNTAHLSEAITYVLPVVIQNVDGNTAMIQQGRVLYLVIPSDVPPTSDVWRITSVSTENGFFVTTPTPATNLLDKNPATAWCTDGSNMPQNVVIDMGKPTPITGVIYYNGPNYLTFGQPLSIKIELSPTGTVWTDMGTFTGSTGTDMKTLPVTPGTTRFIRFTVLNAVKYFGVYPVAEIGEIGVVNN